MPIKYLSRSLAQQLDVDLMSPIHGFSIDQLMELAGLSVAECVTTLYAFPRYPNVCIVVGPGNNGGDGLVTARHLAHAGYNVRVWMPKPPKQNLYQGKKEAVTGEGVEINTAM